jgi:hypothetical protein
VEEEIGEQAMPYLKPTAAALALALAATAAMGVSMTIAAKRSQRNAAH